MHTRSMVKYPIWDFVCRYLVKFLAKLAQDSEVNKMTPSNIAIVLGPNLLWSKTEGTLAEMAAATSVHVVAIIEPIIQHADWFFPDDVDFNVSGMFVAMTPEPDPGPFERRRPGSLVDGDTPRKDRYLSYPRSSPRPSPGWICYAEKTHGEFILPYVSSTRSPQQMMGSLVKGFFAGQQGLNPQQIYHVTVMPCYDKKLEASRPDFYLEEADTREVDCVITSGEVVKMLEEEKVLLSDVEPAPLDTMFSSVCGDELLGHAGSGSGGYLHHVFTHAARQLFGEEVKELTYKTLKNKDFQEVTLERDGVVVLRFAATYGFRNIQNLVQKLKRGKSPYHFVEVMACPSGCLNGGGQVKPLPEQNNKELLQQVEDLYKEERPLVPEEDQHVAELYQSWLQSVGEERARELLHTQYHAVDKATNGLLVKW
uniref:Rho GTPase activating protein 17b n=1 Tax=Oncorhynchus kisutch TaxID=8019 RepID=A0A8C7KQ35_ONCKI